MLIPLETLIRAHGMRPTGVLHLGAHLCEEARYYHRAKAGKVWWVEALPDLAATCEQNLARYPDQQVICGCVGAADGTEVTFHRANNGMSSSVLALGTHLVISPDVSYVADEPMTTVTVDTLVSTHRVRADFINLDLQGYELEALKGAERFLRRVNYVYTEVNWTHVYEHGALIGELDDWLGERGFVRYDTVMAGRAGWGDAIYARPEALGL